MKESAIVTQFLGAASRRAEYPALVFGGEAIGYGELERLAAGVATYLLRDPGREVVGLFLPVVPEFSWNFLGALWAGRTVAVLPTMAPAPLLRMMAAEAGLDRVLTNAELAPRVVEAGLLPEVVESCLPTGATAPPLAARALEEAVLLYTSVTTGRPKAVALSEENLLANIEGCRIAGDFTADDVMQAILPLFHAFGLTVTLLLPLSLGGTVVLEERFVPRTVLQDIEANRVTALIAVPSQYRLIAKETAPTDVSSLRLCIAGAERLSDQVTNDFEKRFKKILFQGYGATEASPVISFNGPGANRPGSVGKPLPNVRVTIREEGRELAKGEHGEVCAEGPSIMLGYFHQPEATSQKISGGMLHTGDRGWRDPDGYLHLAGRVDEMLKVAGEKIYPSEVERAMEQIEGVEQAVVMGMPDAARGVSLVAFVEPQPGSILTEASVRAGCRERLEAGKIPRSILVVEQMPRTATGKLDKRNLLERATESAK
jgi:long-chain acyl-CoA synthetase